MKKFYLLFLMMISLACHIYAQSWARYDASVLPNDASLTPPFVTASGAFFAAEEVAGVIG